MNLADARCGAARAATTGDGAAWVGAHSSSHHQEKMTGPESAERTYKKTPEMFEVFGDMIYAIPNASGIDLYRRVDSFITHFTIEQIWMRNRDS